VQYNLLFIFVLCISTFVDSVSPLPCRYCWLLRTEIRLHFQSPSIWC